MGISNIRKTNSKKEKLVLDDLLSSNSEAIRRVARDLDDEGGPPDTHLSSCGHMASIIEHPLKSPG